jgi:hypothetical protein
VKVFDVSKVTLSLLVALNHMLWFTLRQDRINSDGVVIAVSGFPFSWYRSSVMGTGDVQVSLIMFVLNLLVYWFLAGFFIGLLAKRIELGARLTTVLTIGSLAFVLPVLGAFLVRLALGDWSSFVFVPWEQSDGNTIRSYWVHGLQSFNPK